jgi:DNA-binding transcriptional MerR regulator
MQKTEAQIPLDFGGKPEIPSSTSTEANTEANSAGDLPGKQYLASAGVGVRVKSYKNPAVAEEASAEEEPAAIEEDAAVVLEDAATVVEDAAAVQKSATRTSPVKAGPSKRGRKSLKQGTAEADLIEIPADEVLFSKLYYSMGEVSEMFRVNQSLLRYWETEFDILQPKKNKKGDRHFRPVDIKNLQLIYHLLRQKKYTIEGARDFIKNNKKAKERFEVIERLQQIRSFLLELKTQL